MPALAPLRCGLELQHLPQSGRPSLDQLVDRAVVGRAEACGEARVESRAASEIKVILRLRVSALKRVTATHCFAVLPLPAT